LGDSCFFFDFLKWKQLVICPGMDRLTHSTNEGIETMKKTISVLALTSIFAAGSAMASGWRIPEQSVDSTAKAGANIASSTRADTSYYNPANMSWMADKWHTEVDLTWIYLSSIEYEDSRSPLYNDESEEENFLLPTAFFVSPEFYGMHFGLSLTAPAGLSKRWNGFGAAVAKEFSMTVYEVNPSLSYAIGDMVSVAAGARMVYADATVESDASGLGMNLSRQLEGDTLEWGWNVALAVKPTDKLNISATYRSKVDLDFEDTANLNLMGYLVSPEATVSVPVAAVFALSVAYDVLDNLNVEFTWDRTFWSDYDKLDFDHNPEIPGNPYEPALIRDWDDTDAFRIGITYGLNDKIDLMAGFGYDSNPVPDDKIDFSLPDSDAWLFSFGMQYAVSENLDLGIAALYDYKEERDADSVPDSATDPYGTFTNASAFLLTVGLNYRF
jgi:long-chain fatty acid transport protein